MSLEDIERYLDDVHPDDRVGGHDYAALLLAEVKAARALADAANDGTFTEEMQDAYWAAREATDALSASSTDRETPNNERTDGENNR